MRLEDLFEVVRELGRGGCGRVWLVRDRATGQELAAKVSDLGPDPYNRRKFELEVKQLFRYGRLRHVVKIVRPYLDADPPFFLMPFAKGGTLTQWAGKLTPHQVLTLMRQLMETLVQIHGEGGFHRDVKPDNMLLLGDGAAVLGDFGLGNSPQCTVHFTMHAAGTPGYAAPELMADWPYDASCDVFSAGATWFHLLTGQHPRGLALPLNPRSVRGDVPEWTASWVVAMTQPERAQRLAASRVLGALTQATGGKDARLPAGQPVAPAAVAAGVGGGLLLLLLVIGLIAASD